MSVTSYGADRLADVAGPPFPDVPKAPVPATVEIIPVVPLTFRITLLP